MVDAPAPEMLPAIRLRKWFSLSKEMSTDSAQTGPLEILHTREKMVLPEDGDKKIYSVNEGNQSGVPLIISSLVTSHILLDGFDLWLLISTAQSFVVAVAKG